MSSLFANAQPVLNASDFGTELSMTQYIGNSSGFLPGNAGANQVWDFSGLSLTLRNVNQTFNTVAVGTAISASSFPDSNYCLTTKGTDDYSNIIDIYLFYNLSDTSFESAGSSYPGSIRKYTFLIK